MKILVTGGAGFIGSYVCDELLHRGHHVIALDNLDPQIHGEKASWPEYMSTHENIENVIGDVRDRPLLDSLVERVDAVIHLAAAVGVGQSMYKIVHYCSVSVMGTAELLEAMLPHRDRIKKLIVASSMSIYGEGEYTSSAGNIVYPQSRSIDQLKGSKWELADDKGNTLKPAPTTEEKPLKPDSIYAVNKRDQEEMCLAYGRAYGLPTVAFRMFNVYGARQALSNPYTGVAAIFSSKLLKGENPMVFEDGNQRRDFVHVEDVARAYAMAIEGDGADGLALNLGSGNSVSVIEIATTLAKVMNKENLAPIVTGKYRDGDIRHCFADISLIQKKLGWSPEYKFQEGVHTLLSWVLSQTDVSVIGDSYDELKEMGLLK